MCSEDFKNESKSDENDGDSCEGPVPVATQQLIPTTTDSMTPSSLPVTLTSLLQKTTVQSSDSTSGSSCHGDDRRRRPAVGQFDTRL